jgi:hypothetical protein
MLPHQESAPGLIEAGTQRFRIQRLGTKDSGIPLQDRGTTPLPALPTKKCRIPVLRLSMM